MKAISMALAAALLATSGIANAQTTAATGARLALRDSSTLSLGGTSTLHDFTCRTHTIQAMVEVDPDFLTAPLQTVSHPMNHVEVTIPVDSLKCGDGKMDSNMYGTLRAQEFPTITYVLQSYDVDSVSRAADSLMAHTRGTLTISGQARPVTMDVRISRDTNGVSHARGSLDLKMSDFGIKPPTFFFGTLRVGDRIVINFDLSASRAAVTSVGLLRP